MTITCPHCLTERKLTKLPGKSVQCLTYRLHGDDSHYAVQEVPLDSTEEFAVMLLERDCPSNPQRTRFYAHPAPATAPGP